MSLKINIFGKHPLLSRVAAIFIALLLSLGVCAQRSFAVDAPIVEIEPHIGTAADTYQLTVTVKGSGGGEVSRPEFGESNQFAFEATGTSSRNEFVNGTQSSEVAFNFNVRPVPGLSPGTYSLPQGTMTVGGKEFSLQAPKITVLGTSSQNSGTASNGRAPVPAVPAAGDEQGNSPVTFTQLVDNFEPYAGEQIIYRAEVALSEAVANPNLGYVNMNGFFRESFGKNQEQVREIGNTTVHSVLEALFPAKSGELQIPERTLSANIRVIDKFRRRRSWDMFDDFFGGIDGLANAKMVAKKFIAPAFSVHVKELPPPPEPDLGYIPVGSVMVNTMVDQSAVKQGESIAMKIDVVGDANLKPFELGKPIGGDVNDFKIYVDKPEVEVTPGKTRVLFRKRFNLAFVPQRAGTLTLPKYRVITFNPKDQRYITADTGARVINVKADSQPEKLVVRGGQPVDTSSAVPDRKTDVQSLGEGMLPQHVGPQAYAARKNVNNRLFFLLLFGLPAFVLPFGFVAADRRRRLADPGALLQAQAYRRALDAFAKLESELPENTESNCLAQLRTYLGNRFRLNGESITSADVKRVLADFVKNPEVCERAETLFRKLQLAVYGGAAHAPAEKKLLVSESQALLREVEKNAS